MDACAAVDKEVEKLKSKFNGISDQTIKTLDQLLERVHSIEQQLAECGDDENLSEQLAVAMSQTIKAIKESCMKISADHRDLHGNVSKIGRVIDRNFTSDLSPAIGDKNFEREENIVLMNQVICEHFLRLGRLEIVETLVKECNMTIEEAQKEPFFELNRILEALKQQNLQPALDWVDHNRDALKDQGSALEFKLHRLHFIELLKQGPDMRTEILLYAKKLQPFALAHEREVQVLMGALLYLKEGYEQTPYRPLFDPLVWREICDIFTRDACTMLGLSVESPLSVCFNAGCRAVPVLLNIRTVMQQRQCHGVWSNKDELPVEVDLGPACRYHSIFACPILRLQCTPHNPPMKLVCGHVISRDALNKLTNGSKLKCPYCPEEQSPLDARQVIF